MRPPLPGGSKHRIPSPSPRESMSGNPQFHPERGIEGVRPRVLAPFVAIHEYLGLEVVGLAMLLAATSLSAATKSPLADAAERTDRAAVRSLLKQKVDVNVPQVDGMTALHWAAYQDDTETGKLLLDAGANVKAENRYGVTAVISGLPEWKHGSRRGIAQRRCGPEYHAPWRGDGVDDRRTHRENRTGESPPFRGAKVDLKEQHGQTALMWAAAEGHAAVVELLIEAGADFRTPLADSGFTPMFFAVRDGHLDVVRALLKAGVDVNETMRPRKSSGKGPRKGMSPLILAVENGHFELAEALLEAGADPNDQRSGFTALHTLTWVRKPNRGDGDDGDPAPIGSGNLSSLQFVRKLVQHGADVNARLKTGKSGRGLLSRVGATPFLLAAATDDAALMRLLVELGADPLLGNEHHSTPLMAAAGVGTIAPLEEAGTEPEALEAVQLALDLGADINAVDDNGETAMHGAAYKSLPKVVQLLADRGAKIEVWNRENKIRLDATRNRRGLSCGKF